MKLSEWNWKYESPVLVKDKVSVTFFLSPSFPVVEGAT